MYLMHKDGPDSDNMITLVEQLIDIQDDIHALTARWERLQKNYPREEVASSWPGLELLRKINTERCSLSKEKDAIRKKINLILQSRNGIYEIVMTRDDFFMWMCATEFVYSTYKNSRGYVITVQPGEVSPGALTILVLD
jgi:hypothetical protein